MKNFFHNFLLMGALLLGATGCSEDNAESSANPSYKITVPASDQYEIIVSETAKEGEELQLIVIPAEGLQVTSVLYNGQPCTYVYTEADTNAAQYTFVMPASDVTLTAEVGVLPPSAYLVHYSNEDEYYFSGVPSSATAGDEITFTITVTDLSIGISKVFFGTGADEFCEPDDDVAVGPDYKRYSFTFTMPDHEVTLQPDAAVEYNDILRFGDAHARVRLVNSIIKDENGDPLTDENGEYICRNYYGQLVKFVYEIELGYNYSMTIVGQRTGTHYENQVYFLDSDFDAGQCWAVMMPAEPITFTIVSSEKTDFVGKPFVGNYTGFFVNTALIGQLEKSASTNLAVELKTNTVFEVKTTDANHFDFRGMMSYNESDSQLQYQLEGNSGYGLSGYWNEEMTLAWVTNIVEDMPENTRFYIMSQKSLSDFVSAGNAGGTKYLLEVKTAQGTLSHYLFERERYRLTAVEVDFLNGSSIGDASASGYVTANGEKLLKYTSEDGATNLIEKGKEAGSYTGGTDVLELDGFGNGKIGSQEGSYTISNGIVELTCNGQTTKYNIDMNTMTYTAVAGEGEWNGPTNFYVESTTMAHRGSKVTSGNVRITIDPTTTKATIVAQYLNDMYRMDDAVNTTVSYIYDASASTLTLSQVFMGDETGASWYKWIDVVLTVSPDKQTLTFQNIDALYATSNPNNYVTVTDLAVPAQQQ